jgi:dienelactone hydrolase
MAEMGYVAFAADIYGKGVRPKDAKEAGELAGKYKAVRKVLRGRVLAAYDTLKKNPKVDTNKMLAMGYCFGGTTALELAMSGVPLRGVASFHGGLDFPSDIGDVKNIKTKLLIMHGALDPFVPADQVNTFTKALNDAKTDYQFIIYSGAVHAFTVPEAGNDLSKGTAYNALADKRSFQAMKTFFQDVTQ